jgi:hypothetical protein
MNMKMRYLRRSIDPQKQYRHWIDPRVRTLKKADVVAYLRHRGWKELSPDRPGMLAFQEPKGQEIDGRPVCQFVPDSEEYDVYPLVMFELLTGLAEYEDRQAADIIDDILALAKPVHGNGLPQTQTQKTENSLI